MQNSDLNNKERQIGASLPPSAQFATALCFVFFFVFVSFHSIAVSHICKYAIGDSSALWAITVCCCCYFFIACVVGAHLSRDATVPFTLSTVLSMRERVCVGLTLLCDRVIVIAAGVLLLLLLLHCCFDCFDCCCSCS